MGRGARLIKRAQNLNFFSSSQTKDSATVRQAEIISTRVYVFLTTLIFIVIAILMGLSQETTTASIISPSLDDVHRLQARGYTLTCSCSSITIQFASFVVSEPTFHQVGNY